jgi:hypothetical protein
VEIQVTDNRIIGNDGCGQFEGRLELENWPAIQFVELTPAAEPCMNDASVQSFRSALALVRGFRRENRTLVLTNQEGIALAVFRRVD